MDALPRVIAMASMIAMLSPDNHLVGEAVVAGNGLRSVVVKIEDPRAGGGLDMGRKRRVEARRRRPRKAHHVELAAQRARLGRRAAAVHVLERARGLDEGLGCAGAVGAVQEHRWRWAAHVQALCDDFDRVLWREH